ncbi:MAG: tetratricopeptide repeat protein [candidate division KSB1 bacterium]|nr:tetratricopeptide repeat protein [candidate division KSB1 bacterium]MDZ7273895.1 tetratricopeptide repeat protein [candidate division KSB1 bacterium]MDZ7286051.1 tetratricopeptide repeat protein [candidate division KSB1 bacterium]MDZ7299083.1 tetratricopeptide repeat protein [candidate division KSB1 bacterium]MDZ7306386.1 tetratricopeptide repeat protein [candidate division KSB1 bacterium]
MRALERFLAVWLITSATALVQAQPQNREALQWFSSGIMAAEPDKKIAAYQRAIELDPTYVEALYNLGMVYKAQQQYEQAAQYLTRAYQARPGKTQEALRLQILFELAATQMKLGQSREAEEGLRNAKSLAKDRTLASLISFELGRFLYQQHRYAEALAELRAGMSLDPENRLKFANLIVAVERAQQLQALYDQAQQARQAGNLAEAQAKLAEIIAADAGFRDAQEQYLSLQAKQKSDTDKAAFNALYEEARKLESAGKLELALALYEKLVNQAVVFKDVRTRLQALQQQLAERRTRETLESQYTAGLAALKARDWARAIIIFEKILQTDAEFRQARQKLREAQSNLERENSETVLARFYTEGLTAMKQGDIRAALVAFEKVHKINQDYRDVASLLAEAEEMLANSPAPRTPRTAGTGQDSLYRAAQAAIQGENWALAVKLLEQLQAASPEDPGLVDLLAQARVNLQMSTPPVQAGAQHAEPPVLLISSALMALLLLPVIGFVALSPMLRARMALMRGDYDRAARIYEKILQQQPGRLKLYPALANIYLLTGRRDEQALKVYKTILQLNLITSNRDEITAAVAQSYLSQGRMDADAIKVFEDMLQAEYRKSELLTRSQPGRS